MVVVDALFALVNFMQQFPNELIGIKGDTLDTLVFFATEGTVKQAKYATILACHLLQEETSSEIIEVRNLKFNVRKSWVCLERMIIC